MAYVIRCTILRREKYNDEGRYAHTFNSFRWKPYNGIDCQKSKKLIKEYAQRYNLFLTGGSDFHGRYEPNSPDVGDYISEESGVKAIFFSE